MNPEEDAFGQSFIAYLNGKPSFEIIERDDGYTDYQDTRSYFTTYEEWSTLEKEALSYVKGRVLDVGCGAGRHALYLQKKGFEVLGIDISPLAIEVCKHRGLKKAGVISIEEIDFKPNSFDTIIMMGNNFGLGGSFTGTQNLLRNFYKITSKDAIIIATTRDIYQTDNPDHIEYQKVNREKGRMSGQVKIRVRFHMYSTKWFDFLMVSKEEMKQIIEGTGWEANKFIESQGNYVAILHKKPIKM
jgi:SAM-dependent methyltransferase